MQQQKTRSKAHDNGANQIRTGSNVADILRQMMECIDDDTPAFLAEGPAGSRGEILLDMQIEGLRYSLVCYPPEPSECRIALSPREKEIARLVAKGLPNKTIAAVLDISLWTVGTHLRRLFAKLGVSSRAEMVARILEERLIENIQ